MNVDEIVSKLGLLAIDDQVYHDELKALQLTGHDISQFNFYKRYGDRIMFYTEKYLIETDYETLIVRDKKNCTRFQPNWIKRCLNKVDAMLFNFKWKYLW